MPKAMIRLACNLCNYNMMVTEALEPWAMQVMQAHGQKLHPEAMGAEGTLPSTEPTEKEPAEPVKEIN